MSTQKHCLRNEAFFQKDKNLAKRALFNLPYFSADSWLGTHNSNFGYVYEISLVLTIVIDFQKEIFHTVCISKKNLHLPQFLSLKKVAKNYYQSISGAALRSIAVDTR